MDASRGEFLMGVQEAMRKGLTEDQAIQYTAVATAMKIGTQNTPIDVLLDSMGGDPKKAMQVIEDTLKQSGVKMTPTELEWFGNVAAEASARQQGYGFIQEIALEMLDGKSPEEAQTVASQKLWNTVLDEAISPKPADSAFGRSIDQGQPSVAIDTAVGSKYAEDNKQSVWNHDSGEMDDHRASEQIEEEQATYAEQNPSRMAQANDTGNDWSNATAQQVSKDEKEALISYAAEKGVMVPELKRFDGDPTLLKAEIDALSNIRSEFPVGKKVILSVSQFVDDEDFASTYNGHITLNAKALRSRTITEQNIRAGGMFAVSKLEDIVIHEYGHIISDAKGNRGLEIAKKAYYNLTKIDANWGEILDFLDKNISPYSITSYGDSRNKGYRNQKKYKEIIPEVLAKHNSSPNEFTEEFLRLLKEGFF